MIQKQKTKKEKNARPKKEAQRKPIDSAAQKNPHAPDDTDAKGGKKIRTPALLRGMRDILPKEEHAWQKMYDTALKIASAYGFGQIETPIVEEASLFVRSIGRGTDVVEKEMYVFEDRDGSKVALRPEATASIVRSYIGHGMHNISQPVKLWQYGPMFRHDRPQAGRYRQFHQFDCEVIGERDPVIDAELIVIAYNYLRDLGIETHIDVNSIGNREDRERYVVELLGYLRTKRSYLCEDCKKRMVRNPLRVLDCKEDQCRGVIDEAPQIIDWLSEGSKNFFMKVLEYLDELGVPYMLRSTLVRGLDYYSDTVFEIYTDTPPEDAAMVGGVPMPGTMEPQMEIQADEQTDKTAPGGSSQQTALGGGGRYDGLMEQLGGRPTPACGFAIGLERVAACMRRAGRDAHVQTDHPRKIFFAQLGEQARRRALGLIEDLRRHDMTVSHNLGKASLKAQLELANKIGATHTVIIGQKELQDGTIIIRDMESGIQEIVDQKKLRQELEKILRG